MASIKEIKIRQTVAENLLGLIEHKNLQIQETEQITSRQV